MQKPIRYYITKSGEEPTVRTVRVALGANEAGGEAEMNVSSSDGNVASWRVQEPATAVKRRVKDAIRRRTVER